MSEDAGTLPATLDDAESNAICLWRYADWREVANIYPASLGRHRTCDSAAPAPGDNHDEIMDAAILAIKGDNPAQKQAARRAIHKYLTPDDRAPRFASVWLDDAAVNLDAVPLLKDVIDPGSLCAIYGPSGSGKSLFALDLAGRIAAGCGWRGRTGLSGLCVYVAAEAGASILKRAVAWRETVLADSHQRIPLAIVTRAVNLLDMTEIDALVDDIRALAAECHNLPTLLVFDTLARCMFGGDENSAQDVSAIVAAADRVREALRCAVALIHHVGKNGSKGMRGSSALFAACDNVLLVDDHCVTIKKSRDGIIGEQFPFEIDSVELGHDADREPVTAAVIRATDTPTRRVPARKLPPSARVALSALEETIADHGEFMPATSTIPKGVRAVKLEDWRRQFALRYGGDDRDKSSVDRAFRRAKEVLLAEGAVTISNPYIWLRTKRTDTDK